MGKLQTHSKSPQTRAKRSALSQQVTGTGHWNNAFYHFFHWERCAVDYTHNNCDLICLIALHR